MHPLFGKRGLKFLSVLACAFAGVLAYGVWSARDPGGVRSDEVAVGPSLALAHSAPQPGRPSAGLVAKAGTDGTASVSPAHSATSVADPFPLQNGGLRAAQDKLREIQAELANAQSESEVARLQRNERVVGRMVERMKQLNQSPPRGP